MKEIPSLKSLPERQGAFGILSGDRDAGKCQLHTLPLTLSGLPLSPQKGLILLSDVMIFIVAARGCLYIISGKVFKGCVFIFMQGPLVSLRKVEGNGLFYLPIFTKFQRKLEGQRFKLNLSLPKCAFPKSQSPICVSTSYLP